MILRSRSFLLFPITLALSTLVSSHLDDLLPGSDPSTPVHGEAALSHTKHGGTPPSLQKRTPSGPRHMRTWWGPRQDRHAQSPAHAEPDHVESVQVHEFAQVITSQKEPTAESPWYAWLRHLCHHCDLRPGTQHVIAQPKPWTDPRVMVGRVLWVNAKKATRTQWPAGAPHVVVNQPDGGFDLYQHRGAAANPRAEPGHKLWPRAVPSVDRYKDFQPEIFFKGNRGLGRRRAAERDRSPSWGSVYRGRIPPGRNLEAIGLALAREWDARGRRLGSRRRFVEQYERELLS